MLSCGRRVDTAEGRITDVNGRVLAHGTTTSLIFSELTDCNTRPTSQYARGALYGLATVRAGRRRIRNPAVRSSNFGAAFLAAVDGLGIALGRSVSALR
jgi:hypothetical protein